MRALATFFRLLTPPERRRFALITLISLGGAALEVFGISLLLPFVNALSDAEPLLNALDDLPVRLLPERDPARALQLLGIALVLVFCLKNAYLALDTYLATGFVRDLQSRLSTGILGYFLRAPYASLVGRSAAEIQRSALEEVRVVTTAFLGAIWMLFSELTIASGLVGLLLFSQPIPGLVGLAAGATIILVTIKLIRRATTEAGVQRSQAWPRAIQAVTDAINGVKEIKVLGAESAVLERFASDSSELFGSLRRLGILSKVPRFVVETAAVAAMIGIAVALSTTGTVDMGALALFGVCAIRLLPSVQRVVAAITSLRFGVPALETVSISSRLAQSTELAHASSQVRALPTRVAPGAMPESRAAEALDVEFSNVSFRYPGAAAPALLDVTLGLRAGSTTAILGQSGSGKTTLANLLLGLLSPETGHVRVGQQAPVPGALPIGYVPQDHYILNGTVRENIALGVPSDAVDHARVWSVLEVVQLKSFVEGLPHQLETFVGDRGSALSGGQRQRLALARALYHEPAVLVLDEGTAALDPQTEAAFLRSLRVTWPNMTLVLVTHRSTALAVCDAAYLVNRGRITASGPPDHVVRTARSLEFTGPFSGSSSCASP